MQLGEWTEAKGMGELMAARRKQAPFRLSIAGAFVIGFIGILGDLHILIWGAVYTALQGAEAILFRTERIDSMCNTPGYRALALCILAANITVFASIPFLELSHLGLWGVAYGEAIVACTFLNVALTTHGSKRAFFASLTPGLIYLIILPTMAWRLFGCPPPRGHIDLHFGRRAGFGNAQALVPSWGCPRGRTPGPIGTSKERGGGEPEPNLLGRHLGIRPLHPECPGRRGRPHRLGEPRHADRHRQVA
jgi:hypothetical protein